MHLYERRIYLGLIGVILSFVPILFFAFFSLDRVIRAQRDLVAVNSEQLFTVEKLLYIDTTLAAVMPIYILTGDNELISGFNQRYEEFDQVLEQLSQAQETNEFQPEIERIRELSLELRRLARPGIALRKKGTSAAEVHAYFSKNTVQLSRELRELLKVLSREESKQLEEAKGHFSQTVNWVIGLLMLFSGLTLGLIFFIGRLVVKTLNQKRDYDEAQRKLLEHERRISQARKEVVEVVAHDLKNPLGSVKMSVELALQEVTGQSPSPLLREGLEIAHRSTNAMEGLIKDLLDHAKIESGHFVLEKSTCDMRRLCAELIKRYELLAKQKNIELKAHLPSETCAVMCDVGRIEQVISNLLGNALKFTSSGDKVSLSLYLQKKDARIVVEDSGIGIDKSQQKYIFDRFWQAKETASLGNGLGLSIAKTIIEAHDGQIGVESSKGSGSRFYFTIPRLTNSTLNSSLEDLQSGL